MSHPDRDPGADAVAKAHAVYTPFTLAFYDLIVHGLSNRFAWRCSTARLKALYAANLSANHLEAGVGTGLFIDSVADRVAANGNRRLTLLDINELPPARDGPAAAVQPGCSPGEPARPFTRRADAI